MKMESQFPLAVVIVLFYSCSRVACRYGTFLESAVDIEVIGNHTVRSGVRQYTLFGDSSSVEYIKCTVINHTGNAKNVTIFKNGVPIDKVEKLGEYEWTAFIDNDYFIGNYTCSVMFEIVNGSFSVQYTIDVEVKVDKTEDTHIIASDVGCKVYGGEQVSISCNGFYDTDTGAKESFYAYSDSNISETISTWTVRCPVTLIGDISPVIHIPFRNPPGEVSCDLHQFRARENAPEMNDDRQRCSEPDPLKLEFVHELNIALNTPTFDSTNETLTFVCTSDPPRLMHWTVLTAENSEILDLESPVISANMQINITQKSGYTRIVILIEGGNDKGGNGIETVTCSTYDTKAHVFKTAQRDLKDLHRATLANKIGGVPLALMIILSVFVIVLMLLVIFLVMRLHHIRSLSLKSRDGSNDGDDKVPSETELHDNPAYLPYTGDDDVSP